MILGRASTLGIVLSNTGIQASLRNGGRGEDSFIDTAFLPMGATLLSPFNPDLLANAFASLAAHLPKRAKRLDVSTVIAIPDPLIVERVLEFKAFPENEMEARTLVEARVAREYTSLKARQVNAHQIVSRRDEGVAVLVRSMSLELRDTLTECLSQSGFNLCGLEGYCRFSPSQRAGAAGGSISVRLTNESWFLECASAAGETYFSQAGWIENWFEDEKLIVRLIRTFCLGNQIAPTIHIEGSPQYGAALAERLETINFQVSDDFSELYLDTLARRVAQWSL